MENTVIQHWTWTYISKILQQKNIFLTTIKTPDLGKMRARNIVCNLPFAQPRNNREQPRTHYRTTGGQLAWIQPSSVAPYRSHNTLHRWADCEISQYESSPVLQNWIRSSPDPQNFWKSWVRSSPDPPMQNRVLYFASWGKSTIGVILPLAKYNWFKAK